MGRDGAAARRAPSLRASLVASNEAKALVPEEGGDGQCGDCEGRRLRGACVGVKTDGEADGAQEGVGCR